MKENKCIINKKKNKKKKKLTAKSKYWSKQKIVFEMYLASRLKNRMIQRKVYIV